MNYSEIIYTLESASLFEVWRLNCALNMLLEDQTKNAAIKRALKPGMEVSYFEARENRLILAKVIDIRRTYVLVQNNTDGKNWRLPFYMLNMGNIHMVDIEVVNNKKISKVNLKIGEQVGFNFQGEDMFGRVVKLNPKRALVELPNGKRWRVGYSALFTILNGESREWNIAGNLIES